MAQPRVLILRAPGTNCDVETAFAFERAGGQAERAARQPAAGESAGCAADFQILCMPGGFSYGDDVAAGRILGNQIRHHLADGCTEFKAAGKLILGICNGFQVLIKSGVLLAGRPMQGPPATLSLERLGPVTKTAGCGWRARRRQVRLPAAASRRCTCRWPMPRGSSSPATKPNWLALADAGQLVLRYVSAPRREASRSRRSPTTPTARWPTWPAICDATGRVLGLMPHPERHIDPTQHPRWTRGEARPRRRIEAVPKRGGVFLRIGQAQSS